MAALSRRVEYSQVLYKNRSWIKLLIFFAAWMKHVTPSEPDSGLDEPDWLNMYEYNWVTVEHKAFDVFYI